MSTGLPLPLPLPGREIDELKNSENAAPEGYFVNEKNMVGEEGLEPSKS